MWNERAEKIWSYRLYQRWMSRSGKNLRLSESAELYFHTYDHKPQCRPQLQPGSAPSVTRKKKTSWWKLQKCSLNCHLSDFTTHCSQSLQSRDVQEGDSSKVQDKAVDVHFRNHYVGWKLSVPVDPGRKVLKVSGQVQLLHVALILWFPDWSTWCVQEAFLYKEVWYYKPHSHSHTGDFHKSGCASISNKISEMEK